MTDTKREITRLVEKKIGIHGVIVVDFWRSDAGVRVVFRLSRSTNLEEEVTIELTNDQLEKIGLIGLRKEP